VGELKLTNQKGIRILGAAKVLEGPGESRGNTERRGGGIRSAKGEKVTVWETKTLMSGTGGYGEKRVTIENPRKAGVAGGSA